MQDTQASGSRAKDIVTRLILDPHSAFATRPEHGSFRGIDVYPVWTLLRSIDESLEKYERATGEPAPDPEKATLLREKILWSKFFRPFAVPTPADKLAAHSLLSAEAKRRVKDPPKVWQSTQALLPSNESIPSGCYYLKANHACATNIRVIFPIKEQRRAKLESKAQSWLRKRYGWRWGEWWYSMIEPRIFLEKELDLPKDRPGEFKFYTVNGRITHLHVKWQIADGEATSVYDRDLEFLDLIYKGRPNLRQKLPSKIADLAAIAEELGQGIDFVRVDLYLDRNDEVWLGELTFAPANGLGQYNSQEFEVECCKAWNINRYLYPEPKLPQPI